MATHHHRSAKDALRALAAEIHDDDRPPERKEPSRASRVDRKSLALAGQIRETIDLTIRLNLGDPLLAGIDIEDVVLTPEGVAKVLVSVPEAVSPSDVLARLVRAAPRLRAEVARVITRKRVPNLTFMLSAQAHSDPEDTP